ncbi:hypothetical protein B0H14DRAFT_2649873 [Mycena olivaceomarginata]|nr:hypothetical protein B0H14DRAFT_2649873 [Mycena olivaceomarginata]
MLTSFLPTPPPLPYRARVSVDTTAPALFGPSNREPTLFTSTCRRTRLNPAEPRVPQIHFGNTTQRDNKPGLVVVQPHSAFTVHLPSPAPCSSLSPSYIRSKQHSVTVPPKDQHSGFCTFRGQSAAEDAASHTVLTTYRPHNDIKLVVIQDPPVLKREGCMENKFEKSGNHVLHTSQGSTAPRVSHRVRASRTRTAMRTRALSYSAHTSGTARHLTLTLRSENAQRRGSGMQDADCAASSGPHVNSVQMIGELSGAAPVGGVTNGKMGIFPKEVFPDDPVRSTGPCYLFDYGMLIFPYMHTANEMLEKHDEDYRYATFGSVADGVTSVHTTATSISATRRNQKYTRADQETSKHCAEQGDSSFLLNTLFGHDNTRTAVGVEAAAPQPGLLPLPVEWWLLLRNGSLQRLSFFWDIHAKSPILNPSYRHRANDIKTSRATSNATPAEKENAASSHLELSRTPLQRGRKYKPPGQTPTRAHPHRAYPPPPEAAICSIRWAPPARAADGTGSSPQRSKGSPFKDSSEQKLEIVSMPRKAGNPAHGSRAANGTFSSTHMSANNYLSDDDSASNTADETAWESDWEEGSEGEAELWESLPQGLTKRGSRGMMRRRPSSGWLRSEVRSTDWTGQCMISMEHNEGPMVSAVYPRAPSKKNARNSGTTSTRALLKFPKPNSNTNLPLLKHKVPWAPQAPN